MQEWSLVDLVIDDNVTMLHYDKNYIYIRISEPRLWHYGPPHALCIFMNDAIPH